MNADRQTWFRELEPPPGGAERMRRRLKQRARPAATAAPWIAIAGAAALIAGIALFAVPRGNDDADRQTVANIYRAAQFDRLLGRQIEPTELSVSIDEQTVPVSRAEGSNPKIRIYQVD